MHAWIDAGTGCAHAHTLDSICAPCKWRWVLHLCESSAQADEMWAYITVRCRGDRCMAYECG